MRVDRGAVRIGSDGLAEVFERVDGGDAAGLACGVLDGLRRKRERGAAAHVGQGQGAGRIRVDEVVGAVGAQPAEVQPFRQDHHGGREAIPAHVEDDG
ncbi:hypothetical protein A4U64_10325 [Rhodococcus sp. WB1]|uniref:hypothetical protein n=1 Tax=Rhodococcus sp. 11-3 TaxID=2854796 RepID=UPI00081A2DFF|nr:hypothetical protein [Rhodococcus sp. 11-3]ANZ25032.1 hypothetical protein A4U64_10325 [Rhodococcus sp. WB1]USC13150.1 hypothetical protein KZJ41_15510 [Rhodococcus sp. 11-3]